jgi:hypothetical protein
MIINFYSGIFHTLSFLCFLVSAAMAQQKENASESRLTNVNFSTYFGGSNMETGQAIAIDAAGNVYVTGATASDDFPVSSFSQPFKGGFAGLDVFVAKLGADGALIYSVFLGGSGDELAAAIAVDEQGRAYVAGGTSSSDFPKTANVLRDFQGGAVFQTDGFLVRLSADGATIEYATFFGGSGDDAITNLALGAGGEVYITGTTNSNDLQLSAGAYQSTRAGGDDLTSDGFVARLNTNGANGYELNYATYLGGDRDDIPSRLAVGADGAAWITGFTNSFNFPMEAALWSNFSGPVRDGEGDVFISRLSENGSSLDFSTYIGGKENDQSTGIALDSEGDVYLTGWTASPDFPTTAGAYQKDRQGARDRFVAKLANTSGSWQLEYATRFGSTGSTMGAAGLSVDETGGVWIAGSTNSAFLPTRNALYPNYNGGDADAFIAHFDATGSILDFATYLGGSGAEVISGLALGANTLCVIGNTGSPDFPTQNALRANFDGPPAAGVNTTSCFVSCFETSGLVSVEEKDRSNIPLAFALYQNYPNPFNPRTTIRFDVKAATKVELTIYDILGRRSSVLVDQNYEPGRYETHFDSRSFASGVYFYKIKMGDFIAVRKMVMLR